MVDKQGDVTALTHKWSSTAGLAWVPSGKEIWFSASQAGFTLAVYAVFTANRLRKVSNTPFSVHLFDIARDGRALISLDDMRVSMTAQLAGDRRARDVSQLDSSRVDDISRGWPLHSFHRREQRGRRALCQLHARPGIATEARRFRSQT